MNFYVRGSIILAMTAGLAAACGGGSQVVEFPIDEDGNAHEVDAGDAGHVDGNLPDTGADAATDGNVRQQELPDATADSSTADPGDSGNTDHGDSGPLTDATVPQDGGSPPGADAAADGGNAVDSGTVPDSGTTCTDDYESCTVNCGLTCTQEHPSPSCPEGQECVLTCTVQCKSVQEKCEARRTCLDASLTCKVNCGSLDSECPARIACEASCDLEESTCEVAHHCN